MRIGSRLIGQGPVYVIAEVGSNHDGSLDQAKRLICVAAEAGADCVKFQLYRADTLYPGSHTAGAVPDEWLPELKECCAGHGVEFLCSVFCMDTLAAYLEVEPSAVKIASPEATDIELLAAVYESGLPAFVSTGAMDWEMLDKTELVLGGPHVLLHCVSSYPSPARQMNLRAIPAMIERYGVPVGLSDHTSNPALAPAVAVALGACVIEKHITLDRRAVGPDHSFALEPTAFGLMVKNVHVAQRMLGDGVKRVQPSEDATDRRAA